MGFLQKFYGIKLFHNSQPFFVSHDTSILPVLLCPFTLTPSTLIGTVSY
jgi:hypothetical protein